MMHARQGLHAFLRGYFHHKSADWAENKPFKLTGWTAAELAKIPTYYVMDHDRTMAETVAPHMPTAEQIAANQWMTEAEMGVYSREYGRVGFQGGLQCYRCRTEKVGLQEMQMFHGRPIDVPSMFLSGEPDWGVRQTPGAFEKMQ